MADAPSLLASLNAAPGDSDCVTPTAAVEGAPHSGAQEGRGASNPSVNGIYLIISRAAADPLLRALAVQGELGTASMS